MPSSLDLTLGAVEMGAMMSMMLYGMVTVQMYIYARDCKTDRAWLRALVTCVWCACTALLTLSLLSIFAGVSRRSTSLPCSCEPHHSLCWNDRLMLHSYVYYLTVTRYADETAIGGIKWFTVVTVILSSMVGTPVQVSAGHCPVAAPADIFKGLLYLSLLDCVRPLMVRDIALGCGGLSIWHHHGQLRLSVAVEHTPGI
jgi:hypothetical protein